MVVLVRTCLIKLTVEANASDFVVVKIIRCFHGGTFARLFALTGKPQVPSTDSHLRAYRNNLGCPSFGCCLRPGLCSQAPGIAVSRELSYKDSYVCAERKKDEDPGEGGCYRIKL